MEVPDEHGQDARRASARAPDLAAGDELAGQERAVAIRVPEHEAGPDHDTVPRGETSTRPSLPGVAVGAGALLREAEVVAHRLEPVHHVLVAGQHAQRDPAHDDAVGRGQQVVDSRQHQHRRRPAVM